MKLSSHEEYGLRCLLQVATQGAGGSATIPEISRNEGLSMAYVAKLLRILRQGGLVTAARGKLGGYTLAVPPEKILVADALAALGGRLYDDEFCDRHGGIQGQCLHSQDCALRSLWRAVQGAVDTVLRTITLRDLLHCSSDPALVFLHNRPEASGRVQRAKENLRRADATRSQAVRERE